MSRRNTLFIWFAGIVALTGLVYVVSPWIVAGLVKQELSAWGLNRVRVSSGYPGWRGLRLRQLRFTTTAAGQTFSCHFTDVDVAYRVSDLAAGTVAAIRVSLAEIRVQPAAAGARPTPPPAAAALPLAALVSGQWLSQFPLRNLSLDQVTISGRAPSAIEYTVRLRGGIDDVGAKVSGNVELPAPTRERLAISFAARKTGEARLSLAPAGKAAAPVLEWAINTVTVERDRIKANGMLRAKFDALLPVVRALTGAPEWLAGLEGDFKSPWQALMPVASAGEIRLALPKLQGKGANWDIAGEAGLRGFDIGGREPRLSVTLAGLGGHYKEMAMAGLRAQAVLALGKGIRTVEDARLGVELLEVGFPIRNIEARLQLARGPVGRPPVVRVRKFAAELLGGRVHGEPFELDPGRDRNRVVARIEGIGLNDILQLEQQEDLQGSGKLDGRIPVTIMRGGIEIAQGKLSARAPGGDIRYRPTASVLTLAQSNPGIKMIVDALGNFQYHKLDVTGNYRADGKLLLQVRLEGKNPDWQSGRPVNLNLNLEENIPVLLRSLQLSGEITERMREHYKKVR